jgi:hypothetical protein
VTSVSNAQPTVLITFLKSDQRWLGEIARRLQGFGVRVLPFVLDPDWRAPEPLENMSDRAQVIATLVSNDAVGSSVVEDHWLTLQRWQIDGYAVVPILVDGDLWASEPWFLAAEVLPTDRTPLNSLVGDLLESALGEVAGTLYDRVYKFIGIDRPPMYTRPPSVESSLTAPPAAAGTQPQEQPLQADSLVERPELVEVEPAKAPDGPIPLDHLNSFEFSPLAQKITDAALESMHAVQAPLPLSSSALLFALLASGFDSSAPAADQLSSPAILAQGLSQDTFSGCREAYFSRLGASATSPTAPVVMTQNASGILEQAERIAQRSFGQRQIHARHLAAALLIDDPSRPEIGARARLAELKVDLPRLRMAFLRWVTAAVSEDNPDAWAELFAGTHRYISPYDADSANGKRDLLGVTPDVNAFAALIAATTLVPPLSIGLFGEWGAGKSFFMNQLKQTVDQLSRDSRNADQPQREVPYYKRIVQIEFNAWHYVEGNLWASLVEHIFSNLRVDESSSVRALQEKLLRELKFEKTLADQARQEASDAHDRASAAQAELDELNQKIEADCEKLKDLTLLDVVGQVNEDELPADDRKAINDLLEQSGVGAATGGAEDLMAALDGAQQTLGRGSSLLSWLAKSRHPVLQIVLLVAAICIPLAATVGVGLLVTGLGAADLAQVSGFFAGLAAIAGVLAASLTRATTWLNGWLTRAERIKKSVDARVAKRRAEGQAEIKRLEQVLQHRNTEYLAAHRKADEAQTRLEQKQTEIARTTPADLLASFIQDRIKSNDYRQFLGVLAVVRQDFERLSNLMDLQNWQLSPPAKDDPEERDGVRRFATLDEERAAEDERVNRIVLYIDDLDRCPPRKVVEVLQAVHLLLAFPLFVVVVGVDARWVQRALATAYGQLLTGDGATPSDYLEKVFQIPFWLEQTQPSARRRMLHALLQASVEPERAPADVATDLQDVSAPQDGLPSVGDGAVSVAQLQGSSQPLASVAQSAVSDASTPKRVVEFVATRPVSQGLKMRPTEIAYIDELSVILGRSPRSLKRFVNVYRLLKAGLSEDGQRVLIELGQYRAVLFLLALVTGAPALANAVVARLEKTRGDTPLGEAIQRLNCDPAVTCCAEWPGVHAWLTDSRTRDLGDTVAPLQDWLPRVRRYSFGLGELNVRLADVADERPPAPTTANGTTLARDSTSRPPPD